MFRLRSIPVCLLLLSGASSCLFWKREDPAPKVILQPAGVVTRLSLPEKYLIFESSFPFAAGQTVHAVRDGRRVATLRVHPLRQRPFHAADILDGVPRVGDLVE